jgi:hypothetical protein
MQDKKDFNSINGSKGKTQELIQKKIPPGTWMSVSCECCVLCCQVEVSATSWSLVQRSPTECGVSQMCVTMKPQRNEEAQAHIGLSRHKEKILEDWLGMGSATPLFALYAFMPWTGPTEGQV